MSWISQAEIVERIETARSTAPLYCPTCGSVAAGSERRCVMCAVSKPLSAFVRNRTKPLGFEYRCKPCNRVYRRQQKIRLILGRVS